MKKLMRKHNLRQIYSSQKATIAWIIAAWLISRLMRSFTDLALIKGNMWIIRMYLEAAFHIIFALFFGVFVAATTYKWYYMKKITTTEPAKGIIGWLLWTLVAGCPACTITLASYVGLASLMSALPRWWLELKILGLLFMVWSIYDTVKNLHACNISPTRKNK